MRRYSARLIVGTGVRDTLAKMLTLPGMGTAHACRPVGILAPARGFLALLPARLDEHLLGWHRQRIDDALFGRLAEALVLGGGYVRLADTSGSATTMRRGAPGGRPALHGRGAAF